MKPEPFFRFQSSQEHNVNSVKTLAATQYIHILLEPLHSAACVPVPGEKSKKSSC